MRKPDQIRAVYAELRALLGRDVPAGDLLKIADIIVRAFSSEPDEMSAFGKALDSRALLFLPLDEAIMDGGWRVLELERILFDGSDDDEWQRPALRSKLSRYLGLG